MDENSFSSIRLQQPSVKLKSQNQSCYEVKILRVKSQQWSCSCSFSTQAITGSDGPLATHHVTIWWIKMHQAILFVVTSLWSNTSSLLMLSEGCLAGPAHSSLLLQDYRITKMSAFSPTSTDPPQWRCGVNATEAESTFCALKLLCVLSITDPADLKLVSSLSYWRSHQQLVEEPWIPQ